MKKDPNLPWFYPNSRETGLMGWRDDVIIGNHVPTAAAIAKICDRLEIFQQAHDEFVELGFESFTDEFNPGASRVRALKLNSDVLRDALAVLDPSSVNPLDSLAASGIADIEAFLRNSN